MPDQMMLTYVPIAPAAVPPPPGPIVANIIGRLDAAPTSGDRLGGEVEIQVTYPANAVPPADRGKLALGRFNGTAWEKLQDQNADQAGNRITARTDRTGIYALYRQP